MRYSIKIKRTALKELSRITKADRHRIAAAIDALATNPYVGSALKGERSGLRRIRVGNYRVVYELDEGELLVLVVRVAHRQGVYKRT